MSSTFKRWAFNGLVLLASAISGLFHLSGRSMPLDMYDQWGYPREFSDIIGFSELETALLLAISGTRLAGSVIGGVIAFSAIVTGVFRGGDVNVTIPLALLAAVLLNVWLTPPRPAYEGF